MTRMRVTFAWLAALAIAAAAVAGGADKVDTYRWNLNDLYPNKAAFLAARDEMAKSLPQLEAQRGKLAAGPAAMKAALDTLFAMQEKLGRLFSYASMLSDEDTRVPESLGMLQEMRQVGTEFGARSSWLAPEILALPAGRVEEYLKAEAGLAPYAFFLRDLERQRAHTLTPAEEKLLAQTGLISPAAGTVYGVFSNADMPYAEITLSGGQKVRLDQAAYTKYRALPNRADRLAVFQAFWKSYKDFERTFGTMMDAQVKRDLFYAQARKFNSCLEASLADSNVPEAVYRTLVAEANRALPTLHRAFRLRGQLLGIKDLGYHDIYPQLVPALDSRFPIAEGEGLVLDALAPLGPDYVAAVKRGFDSRWMDVFPRPGKRSGAYSNGVYGVHSFVLMNYNDDYESVSTLAHEWGHAMHSQLANAAQPFPTADYPIFVAEVASTFNEALLLDKMLKQAKVDDERLILLGSALETMRGTFFRQTMFAEFELATHAAAERGEALTGEKLSKIYGELLRRYHGHDQGVVRIDDLYTVEWAYIPHFYRNFYVFQYATSLAASAQLARDVMDGKAGAKDRYVGLLKAGGSRYPYELLRDAGVDLATPTPYRALVDRMNWTMDEIEKIVARRSATAKK